MYSFIEYLIIIVYSMHQRAITSLGWGTKSKQKSKLKKKKKAKKLWLDIFFSREWKIMLYKIHLQPEIATKLAQQ